ncbi:MAG: spike base protein, RCAP_Rcc01079 family [Candidatus Thorarchaeota archaeon]|jgi:hypothetical protein
MTGSERDRPAGKAFAITPNDTTDLDNPTRGLYVGVAGDVTAILIDDDAAVTFVALAAGIIHPISCSRVLATGTAATDILGID